jgi:ParB-like chromosome segregation protein Spo0J
MEPIEQIDTVEVPVADLKPYRKNARLGNVSIIKESLQNLGQYRAVVVNRGTHTGRPNEILAGNHTWIAARELQWPSILVHYVDVDDEQARKIVLVDNRSNDVAGYDKQLLADLLQEADDLIATGYTQADLDKMLEQSIHEGDADTADNMEYVYGVVIECADEQEQRDLLEEQMALGRVVRALV